MIGDLTHNFTDGLSIGVAYIASILIITYLFVDIFLILMLFVRLSNGSSHNNGNVFPWNSSWSRGFCNFIPTEILNVLNTWLLIDYSYRCLTWNYPGKLYGIILFIVVSGFYIRRIFVFFNKWAIYRVERSKIICLISSLFDFNESWLIFYVCICFVWMKWIIKKLN